MTHARFNHPQADHYRSADTSRLDSVATRPGGASAEPAHGGAAWSASNAVATTTTDGARPALRLPIEDAPMDPPAAAEPAAPLDLLALWDGPDASHVPLENAPLPEAAADSSDLFEVISESPTDPDPSAEFMSEEPAMSTTPESVAPTSTPPSSAVDAVAASTSVAASVSAVPTVEKGEATSLAAFSPSKLAGGQAKIKVVGVGGGGANSVEGMLKVGLPEVQFLVVNTDVQALMASSCPLRLQIGTEITHGLGAGADPEIGRLAAEASIDQIREFLTGADMVFITAGMGGGTGTGAAPVVAKVARDMNILSVAVCTKPFGFEGPRRAERASAGLKELAAVADTMIVVANDKLLVAVGQKTAMRDAFALSNTVLAQGVTAISEIVSRAGLINVDFADVRSIMRSAGDAIMGIGRAKGEQRAINAVRKACASPVLDKLVIDGAGGILVSIVGGPDLTLHEVGEAVGLISKNASKDADIIFGAAIDENLGEEVKVTILATRFEYAKPGVNGAALASAVLSEAPSNGSPSFTDVSSSFDEILALHADEEPIGVANGAHGGPNGTNGGANGTNGALAAEKGKNGAMSVPGEPTNSSEEEDDYDLPAYLRRRRRRRFF